MKAKALRSLGYHRLGTRNDPMPVPGVRYIVTNGKTVEAAICNETLEGSMFWDAADAPKDTLLGEFSQWPWFKEDKE